MGLCLSGRKLKNALKKLPEGSFEDVLARGRCHYGMMGMMRDADGPDMGLYDDFIRIMEASKSSDVADISNDRILKILSKLSDLSGMVVTDDPVTGGKIRNRLVEMRGIKLRRRVL